MSTFQWFAVGIGAAGFLYTFREVTSRVMWMYDHYPEADNVAGGIILGLMAACVWPIVLPIVLIRDHGTDVLAEIRYAWVERAMATPTRVDYRDIEKPEDIKAIRR